MITSNFFQQLLITPALKGCNRLNIISSDATPAMAFYHLNKIYSAGLQNIEISLIVGNAEHTGMNTISMRGFKELACNIFPNNFECFFRVILPYINSRIFIWSNNNNPVLAFTGSINYTISSFNECMHLESATECDPIKAYSYFNHLVKDTINCKSVSDDKLTYHKSMHEEENISSSSILCTKLQSTEISLLDRTGKMHKHGGLNWGQRPGRNKNQAYIQLPVKIYRNNFFPTPASVFSVLTDDNDFFFLTRAQKIEGTALHSLPNNHILGAYFRKRLELPSGAFINKSDIDRYGRDTVTFFRKNFESYLMDFSNNNG